MNRRRNLAILWVFTVIAVFAAVGVLTWQNLRYTRANPGGNEFLVQWMGTRNFLTSGTSPYSDETALKVQELAYGRAAGKGEPQLRNVYPFYSMAIFFPFALIPKFEVARAVFMTILELALVLTIIFSIRLARWRPHILQLLLFVLFSLFWFHSIRPLLDGSVSILVALFVTAGFLALKNGGDGFAGLLFALATIKPNVVVLLVLFVLIWAAANSRWQLVGWLVGTIFLLSAASALLLPDWIIQNLREVIQFPSANPPGTLGGVLAVHFPAMAARIARLVYAVLIGMIVVEWWWSRHADFRGFLWAALFTLVLSQWVGIPTSPQNFIVLLPALALVFSTWEERWRRAGQILTVISILLLFGGIWGLHLATTSKGLLSLPDPLLFLPLPAFLIITLYWVRWWAIRPPNVWIDNLYTRDFR